MVYEWDDKEAECYRLYVEEKKPLDEVMHYMKEVYGFNPSKRAYQTQFKRWEFPSKQNPAHKNEVLVERIRTLWENNVSQKEMLAVLNSEGFDVKERELMRVRAKHRWLLRVPNGTKNTAPAAGAKRKRGDAADDQLGEASIGDVEQAVAAENAEQLLDASPSLDNEDADEPEALAPEVVEKRRQRLEKLQKESAERYVTKKRRRRTRGWAGLPADPPGPPRFPSETTIDESKAYLRLDNERYREMRDQFMEICRQAGFVKKTEAGASRWQDAKTRLKEENSHIYKQFHGPDDGIPQTKKNLALDVVCTDVTKRMRTLDTRMTIADAKNILSLNPEQSREVRAQFYSILNRDHFTSKLEAGPEHWDELKQQWINGSELLQGIMSDEQEAPQRREEKRKAVEVLCRDVMKRMRDDQTRRDPSRKRQINNGPGPGPAPPKVEPKPFGKESPVKATTPNAPTAPMVSGMPRRQTQGRRAVSAVDNNPAQLQIDPSLLAAASDPALIADQLREYAAQGQSHEQQLPGSAAYSQPGLQRENSVSSQVEQWLRSPPQFLPQEQVLAHRKQHVQLPSQPVQAQAQAPSHNQAHAQIEAQTQAQMHQPPVPLYFRISPSSQLQPARPLWIGTLGATAPLLADLKTEATRNMPRAEVAKVEGVVPSGAGETTFAIDSDDELIAFLAYVVGGKATFLVSLRERAPVRAGKGDGDGHAVGDAGGIGQRMDGLPPLSELDARATARAATELGIIEG